MFRTRLTLFGSLFAGALALAACCPASAQFTFAYTSFDPPAPSGGYTAPLANSLAYGISNNGSIVGLVGDNSGITTHGYVAQNGVYSAFDYPGTTTGGFNNPFSINVAGDITGFYLDPNGNESDYIYHNGLFSSPVHGNASLTGFNQINDAGQVATIYAGANGIAHSAIYTLAGQSFTDLPDETPYGTYVTMVGSNGTALVNYVDVNGDIHGSLYNNGVYTQLDFPGAQDTHLDSINSSGLIAGHYTLGGQEYGLAYQNGVFSTLDVPGATYQEFISVNNADQIAGFYTDQVGVYHSVIAQATATPEPGNIALLVGMGITGTGFVLRCRRLRKGQRNCS